MVGRIQFEEDGGMTISISGLKIACVFRRLKIMNVANFAQTLSIVPKWVSVARLFPRSSIKLRIVRRNITPFPKYQNGASHH